MEQEGFKAGDKVCVKKGAEITSENGTNPIKKLTHNQKITIFDILEEVGDQPSLVSWKNDYGSFHEAKVEDCFLP